MSRSVPEWIGKTDDTPAPDRVRVRVFDRAGGCCHRCGRKIHAGERWTLEHLKALINGGQNRERNLGVTCDWCLPEKNAEDVAEKSVVYAKRAKHILPREKRSRAFQIPDGYEYSWTKRRLVRISEGTDLAAQQDIEATHAD